MAARPDTRAGRFWRRAIQLLVSAISVALLPTGMATAGQTTVIDFSADSVEFGSELYTKGFRFYLDDFTDSTLSTSQALPEVLHVLAPWGYSDTLTLETEAGGEGFDLLSLDYRRFYSGSLSTVEIVALAEDGSELASLVVTPSLTDWQTEAFDEAWSDAFRVEFRITYDGFGGALLLDNIVVESEGQVITFRGVDAPLFSDDLKRVSPELRVTAPSTTWPPTAPRRNRSLTAETHYMVSTSPAPTAPWRSSSSSVVARLSFVTLTSTCSTRRGVRRVAVVATR